ncbi:DHA1 family inner membrane transport protein [Nitrospirillum amazonense]|uniref:DHA1 family inner membrane transport protein n=1 Tax=Nitrospirillum amazonense TaxID=28077 RepID=A0A560ESH2_9PROT|nr:MFS transporter [Nitrospirillum amazonense]TWB12316.1 DHA1 family inner membrane transport protein [Nitrospirillum amazonense]
MSPSRSPDAAAAWPAWPLRLLALAYFTMGTGTLAVVGALPPIAASLSLSPSAVALMVSAFAATFAVAAPVVQMVAGHLPRRTLLLAGLGILGACTLLSAGVGSYPLLLILRILSGVGAACVGPVVSALGSTLVPPQRQGRALAIVFSGMTMASVVGLPLSAWLGEQIGWRPLFVGLGVWTWGVALAVALGVKDRGRGHAVRLGQLVAVLRRPGVAGGVALMVCQMAGLFTTVTLINPLLRDRFGADTAETSLALMVLGLSGLAGNYLARWLADLWSADRLVAVSLGGLTAMFLAMAGAPARLWAALALLVLWALANDLFMPSQQRRMVELAPDARGLVLALNSSALYVGMAAGSFTAGAVEPLAGVGMLPLVSAGLMAVGLGLLAATRRRRAVASASGAEARATRTVQPPAACPAAR